jgi:predicted acylesterase/phospholipase RssA
LTRAGTGRERLLIDLALQGGGAHGAFTWGVLDRLLDEPLFLAADMMARVLSPYDLNLAGADPLRNILVESIDFGHLSDAPIKLFVTATNVRTGRGRVPQP